MKSSESDMYKRAIGLGALSGLRAMAGPAFLSHYLSHGGNKKLDSTVFSRLANERVSTGLALAEVGEMVGDKLPFTPDRVKPAPLAGRAVSGALVGAIIFINEGEQALIGATTGAASAVLFAFVGYWLRTKATSKLHIPNVVAGLLEDGIVVGVGSKLVSS